MLDLRSFVAVLNQNSLLGPIGRLLARLLVALQSLLRCSFRDRRAGLKSASHPCRSVSAEDPRRSSRHAILLAFPGLRWRLVSAATFRLVQSPPTFSASWRGVSPSNPLGHSLMQERHLDGALSATPSCKRQETTSDEPDITAAASGLNAILHEVFPLGQRIIRGAGLWMSTPRR